MKNKTKEKCKEPGFDDLWHSQPIHTANETKIRQFTVKTIYSYIRDMGWLAFASASKEIIDKNQL
jgi:hypothetical protein